MVWIVQNKSGICGQLLKLGDTSGEGNGNGDRLDEIFILGSVGIHGYNYPDDVKKIQDALNRVAQAQGGAHPKLKPDGLCGDKTKQAIQKFQLMHFGWSGADGLVEVARQTLARLNEILGTRKIQIPNVNLVEANTIQLALSMINAARSNILMAMPMVDKKPSPGGGLTVFSRESLMRLLNKHFSIDDSHNPIQAFAHVKGIFNLMWQVFQRPGGLWGVHTFERDPLALDFRAYAAGGGYFKSGKHTLEKGVKMRLDSIFLCKRFFEESAPFKQAFIIVHECAHFVDLQGSIKDFAYNRESGGAKIRGLPPFLKQHNANCYSNFAYEARTGQEPWFIT
ncbi:MAG: peptidoglycan-binding protein [Candidatus Thiodiazotropha sp.]